MTERARQSGTSLNEGDGFHRGYLIAVFSSLLAIVSPGALIITRFLAEAVVGEGQPEWVAILAWAGLSALWPGLGLALALGYWWFSSPKRMGRQSGRAFWYTSAAYNVIWCVLWTWMAVEITWEGHGDGTAAMLVGVTWTGFVAWASVSCARAPLSTAVTDSGPRDFGPAADG